MQARKEGAEGEEWQPLQLAISQPSELIHANHSPSTSDIPDRPPGLHRTDGKAPPSPPNTEASPAADASSVFEQVHTLGKPAPACCCRTMLLSRAGYPPHCVLAWQVTWEASPTICA